MLVRIPTLAFLGWCGVILVGPAGCGSADDDAGDSDAGDTATTDPTDTSSDGDSGTGGSGGTGGTGDSSDTGDTAGTGGSDGTETETDTSGTDTDTDTSGTDDSSGTGGTGDSDSTDTDTDTDTDTGTDTDTEDPELPACRGIVAAVSGDGVYVGWRLKATDPTDLAFNVYRDNTLLNPSPIMDSTNWLDLDGSAGSSYHVSPVLDGKEQGQSEATTALATNYISIPLQNPTGKQGRLVGTGDLDGDCDFDFVVKVGNHDFDVTQYDQDSEGETFTLEAYDNEGAFLWRRDLGPNIRPGVWHSPMAVFDLDGDGRAEVVLKAGEIDESLGGDGDLNGDGITDYADDLGNVPVHEHPDTEFLEVWDGETGQTRARTAWIDVGPWGSDGNRYNRNMMAPAYLGGDGENPSIVITRGGNSRNEIHAYDLVDDELVSRWTWSIANGGGNYGHNLRTGDIDDDGRDEFLFFSRALDHDGTEMWNTNEAHGDRFHLTDIDPARPGLEIFYIQEFGGTYVHPVHVRDAASGALVWGPEGDWGDVGRGLCANVDPTPGVECWASAGDLYSATGQSLGPRPNTPNMAIWWDADLQRELIDQNRITKVGGGTLLTADGCGWGTRNIPMGYGDVLGDWREEAWWLCDDNTELRIYLTTDVASTRLYALMQDPIYRTSIGAMMMGYVQASQVGFYLGEDMPPPPTPYVSIPAGQ